MPALIPAYPYLVASRFENARLVLDPSPDNPAGPDAVTGDGLTLAVHVAPGTDFDLIDDPALPTTPANWDKIVATATRWADQRGYVVDAIPDMPADRGCTEATFNLTRKAKP